MKVDIRGHIVVVVLREGRVVSRGTRYQGNLWSAHRAKDEEHERHDGHSSSAGSEIEICYELREPCAPVRTFVSTVSRTTRGIT
jgi:hypothetical protein